MYVSYRTHLHTEQRLIVIGIDRLRRKHEKKQQEKILSQISNAFFPQMFQLWQIAIFPLSRLRKKSRKEKETCSLIKIWGLMPIDPFFSSISSSSSAYKCYSNKGLWLVLKTEWNELHAMGVNIICIYLIHLIPLMDGRVCISSQADQKKKTKKQNNSRKNHNPNTVHMTEGSFCWHLLTWGLGLAWPVPSDRREKTKKK